MKVFRTSPYFYSFIGVYGQGGLVCCGSWGCKESDTTEWLNWTELIDYFDPELIFLLELTRFPGCPVSFGHPVLSWVGFPGIQSRTLHHHFLHWIDESAARGMKHALQEEWGQQRSLSSGVLLGLGYHVSIRTDRESKEWSESEREKHISSMNTYMWDLEK